jgi:hypothetical protein
MLHVGMNIPEKTTLCLELARVLRPNSRFGIYDVMRTGDGELMYSVPWAATPDMSMLAAPVHYRRALEAGFKVTAQRNRRDFALAFFNQMRTKISAAGGPPPLGLHILMGQAQQTK